MQTLPEELYTVEQVLELERIVIEDEGVAGIELMRKAGLEVFELISREYPDANLVIFCGAGNNAGDGYVVARFALESGFNVRVYPLFDPNLLKSDAKTAYQEYIHANGRIRDFHKDLQLHDCIIVDALFGTGLNRKVGGKYTDAINIINQSSSHVVSVDIPSGLHANTGKILGVAIKADWTVSFIALKRGLFTGFAAEYCGKIIFESLDVKNEVLSKVKNTSKLILSPPCIVKRHRCSHKGNNGHVLLIGGDHGFSGAIRLAAESALRVGAGLVSIATRKSHASLMNLNRPELMCHGIESSDELRSLIKKATIIVIGPGLGQSQWAKDLFQMIVQTDKPLICDADALNILATEKKSYDNWVLTPHPGEASRLLKCSTDTIAVDRFDAITKLQKMYGGVALLKGAGTLISNGQEITISTTGNPGMASGGMGDVLAGMIGGFIAQGMTLYDATKAAVYFHGKAADVSAQQQGEIGLLASDLFPIIRKLINQCI